MNDRVPPNVHEDQLELLLNEQHESEILDYKSDFKLLDPSEKSRALAEMAKDVAAMASGRGGHLIVGVNGKGEPTGMLDAEQAAQLDEARLRPKLERFLPEGLEIRSAIHEMNGHLVALIHVATHSDGLVIMKKDGSYHRAGKEQHVFRAGEIFIRRGTESRPIGQAELRKRLDQMRRDMEARARAEAMEAIAPLAERARKAEVVAASAAEVLTWDLDLETLVSAITEQLRQEDDIPVRLLLDRTPAVASRILKADPERKPLDLDDEQSEAQEQLANLLDRVVAVAARGLILEAPQLFDLSVAALDSIYNGVFDEGGYERMDLVFEPARVWLMVIERVYALGAFAVRKKRWNSVVELAQHWPATAYGGRSWLRHGYVMAARARLLEDPDNQRSGTSLLKLALNHIVAIPQLRPDYDIADERLLNSLTQFDVLANLAVVGQSEDLRGLGYPHFRRFSAYRSDPAIVALLREEKARSAIFPQGDDVLAEALRALAEIASGEFFYLGGWDEYEDERIRRLLEENPRA